MTLYIAHPGPDYSVSIEKREGDAIGHSTPAHAIEHAWQSLRQEKERLLRTLDSINHKMIGLECAQKRIKAGIDPHFMPNETKGP